MIPKPSLLPHTPTLVHGMEFHGMELSSMKPVPGAKKVRDL